MTSQTTTTSAHEALAKATESTSAAAAALDAAENDVPRAQQALADAEAKVVELLTAAAVGDRSANMPAIGKARAQVEKAKSDIEWAALKRQAAETAYRRAVDAECAARRRVIADEYLAEHARWNDSANRETVLLAQLTDVVAELTSTIPARKALHTRLAQEREHFPLDEKFAIPHGRPIGIYDTQRGAPLMHVPVPEIADAIKAGIEAAEADAKAKAQAAQQDRLVQTGT